MSVPNGFSEIPKPDNKKVDEYWKPTKEGDSVQGKILEFSDGEFGKQIIIATSDNKTIMLPSHAALKSYYASLKVGDTIYVVFEKFYKTNKGTGQDYKVFKQ
jgi:hypothetical protein